MAAAEQLDTSVEYEIRYFEQGKMHSMIVVAENKKGGASVLSGVRQAQQ